VQGKPVIEPPLPPIYPPPADPRQPTPPPQDTGPKQRGYPDGGNYNPGPYAPPGQQNPRGWSEQPLPTEGSAWNGGRAPSLYTAGGAPQVGVDQVNVGAFMNPYIKDFMEPTLRDIEQRFSKQRRDIGATAATSGAFGDDRHRMLDQSSYKDERSQLADTMSSLLKQGWDTSLGAAERDTDRLLGASQFNAGMQDRSVDRQVGVQENAANRDMSWNQFLNQLDQQEQDRALRASELGNAMEMAQNGQMLQYGQEEMGFDNYQRGWDQQQKNADYEDYMQKIMWPMTVLKGSGGTGGNPYGQQGDNGLASLIGSLIGGFF
jgi:hypothetical protein